VWQIWWSRDESTALPDRPCGQDDEGGIGHAVRDDDGESAAQFMAHILTAHPLNRQFMEMHLIGCIAPSIFVA
jgi:hypothetical protein